MTQKTYKTYGTKKATILVAIMAGLLVVSAMVYSYYGMYVEAQKELGEIRSAEEAMYDIPDSVVQPSIDASIDTVVDVKVVEPKATEVEEVKKESVVTPERPQVREELEPSRGSKSYSVYVTASAYTPDPSENGGSGLCFDGSVVRAYHSVAVDPRVIPLGSQIYVPGIGWMLATDTGGDIKGNRIDVCLPDKATAYTWGRKRVELIVIPPER